MMTVKNNRPAALQVSRRTQINKWSSRETIVGWLFALPALLMYAVFVLLPFLLTIFYSFYKWNGTGPMIWVGLKNYGTVFQVPNLIGTVFNAFWLVIWFSFIPVGLGLVVASSCPKL
jgi:raffinose/stachyose/melibiose transport system permease protein